MNIIKPSYIIYRLLERYVIYDFLESVGRVCYKSEGKITANSAEDFLKNIIKSRHESVIEHYSFAVRFICDRGVSHELVRHRLASFSQESTRYCNYSKDRFGNELTVIKPCFWEENSSQFLNWRAAMEYAEAYYFALLSSGATPQEARSVLPNSLKTEIVVTANLREWRHLLRLRTSKKAHPQMQELMQPLLEDLKRKLPVFFEDISY